MKWIVTIAEKMFDVREKNERRISKHQAKWRKIVIKKLNKR